jgi:hypothetical protein
MIIINSIVGINHHFLVFQRNFASSFRDSNINFLVNHKLKNI